MPSLEIRDLLRQAAQHLSSVSDSPRLDAELLLAGTLQKPRSYLFSWPEQTLTLQQQQAFDEQLKNRKSGQPIAYLLGYREFWGLELKVTPDTLIPRPDTELLVDTALDYLTDRRMQRILDLGTGSGAIALALANERPDAQIIASDISAAALQVARDNASRHRLENIHFIESDWLENIATDEPFDVIIANPPYIAADDAHLHQGDVRFEPVSALVSGLDGLDAIRHLVCHAPAFLKPEGLLMFEHGYDQGEQTVQLLLKANYRKPHCLQDIAGHDRVTLGHRPDHLLG